MNFESAPLSSRVQMGRILQARHILIRKSKHETTVVLLNLRLPDLDVISSFVFLVLEFNGNN